MRFWNLQFNLLSIRVTVFVINIIQNDVVMHNRCQTILSDYFTKHKIKVRFLTRNDYSVHPSWLKLKCFDYIEDDFVLCWDLDLLPKRNSPSIEPLLNINKINLALDSCIVNRVNTLQSNKYNCGLIGIPKTYKPLIEQIFDSTSDKMSAPWEQAPINEAVAKNNFIDVHELDENWNKLYYCNGLLKCCSEGIKAIHYADLDPESRHASVALHYKQYFSHAYDVHDGSA